MRVEITRAGKDEKSLVASLMQSYLHELDVLSGDATQPEVAYAPDAYFDAYWEEADRYPFLIKSEGEIVGFCLVRSVGPDCYAIAEFYVVPHCRQSGVGGQAARTVFNMFSGQWQVAQLASNSLAQKFWRRAIADFTGDRFSETWSHANPVGPMQTFVVSRQEG